MGTCPVPRSGSIKSSPGTIRKYKRLPLLRSYEQFVRDKRAMLKIFLFPTLLCTLAIASVPKDAKQQKRGIIGNDGWIGLPSSYGHGQPWSIDHTPLKLPEVNLHAGLHLAGATYGRGGIALAPGILKTLPVYITKHVVVEKPVPVPEPVIIEKPYHVPVPIEKIVHKPVPVPVPVPQAVPIPVDRPVPIPVKQPIAVPVQQPYPVPVKHTVPVPIPVPVPVPVHPLPPPTLPLISTGGLAGAIYARDYAPDHLYPVHPLPAALHLDHGIAPLAHGIAPLAHGIAPLAHGIAPLAHGIAPLAHGIAPLTHGIAPLAHGIAPLAHGIGHGLGHVLAHGYGHGNDYHDVHADHLAHGHDHKKRKTDKN